MLLNFIMSISLFLIGSLVIFSFRKNLVLCLMSLELMLLAINMNFVFFSLYTDTVFGQISTFFILVIGACESAIGLALIVISFIIMVIVVIINIIFNSMYLLPIYFCFFSFIVSSLFGRFFSSKGSILINLLCIFYSF